MSFLKSMIFEFKENSKKSVKISMKYVNNFIIASSIDGRQKDKFTSNKLVH